MSKINFSGNILIDTGDFNVSKSDVEKIFTPEACELISFLHDKFKN